MSRGVTPIDVCAWSQWLILAALRTAGAKITRIQLNGDTIVGWYIIPVWALQCVDR